ncbi:ATP-binding protein [Streptacidiphilus sp. MAP5-3]
MPVAAISSRSWQTTVPGGWPEASQLRQWVRRRLEPSVGPSGALDDAVLLTHQLFVAVLASAPERALVTLALCSGRLRISVVGPNPLPPWSRADWGITRALATAYGRSLCAVWAEVHLRKGEAPMNPTPTKAADADLRLDWQRSYPLSTRSAHTARREARVFLEHVQVAAAKLEDAVLVLSELASNAVRHGYVSGRHLLVRIRVEGDTVRLEVSDPSPVLPAPACALADDEGRRGLVIVDALSTRWGVRHRPVGKTVWAVIGGELQ